MAGFKRIKNFRRSVRYRLTVWYLGVLSLVLVVFELVVLLVIVQGSKNTLDDNLRNRSSQIQASYNPATKQFDPQIVNLGSYSTGENGPEFLLFLNSSGQPLQQSGNLGAADTGALKRIATQPRPDGELIRDYNLLQGLSIPASNQLFDAYRLYVSGVSRDRTVVGSLILGVSRKEVLERNRLTFLTLLILTPLALIASAGGGYWLATRAMKPVQSMSETVREISETDLSKRVKIESQDELGELAATFDQMLERLENAFNRQRQFVADASHELRTPLTILTLEVEEALVGHYQNEQFERMLPILKDEITYMTWVINDLLTLARADSNQIVLKLEELDLSELVLEVTERLTGLAQQKQLEIKADELPELTICGDYLYLIRMLNNLVENAIKYTGNPNFAENLNVKMGEGKPEFAANTDRVKLTDNKWIKVETGIVQQKWAWVRISDNGPGIASNHLPYLFDRFYRVDTSRNHHSIKQGEASIRAAKVNTSNLSGGSGLGLAIVKMIAELHGGKVMVESQVGQDSGSSFEIWLPLVENTDTL